MENNGSLSSYLKLKFSLLQITFYCSVGSFSFFAVTYFKQVRGLSSSYIAIMLGVFTLSAFLGQFFWSFLCDKWKTNKKIYIISNLLMLIICVIVFYTSNVPYLFIAYGALGFVQSSIPANLDTWVMKVYHDNPSAYGPIRASASLFFAVFIFFYGDILENLGYSVMLIFVSGFAFVGIFVACLTVDSPFLPKILKSSKSDFKILMNTKFIILLFVLLCTGIASSSYQIMPLIIDNIGGSVKWLGYAMFASALSQVPFMMYNRIIMRFRAEIRLITAGVFYILSLLLFSFASTPIAIVYINILSGMGFGIMLPAMRQIVYENSPDLLHTTAIGISDSVNVSMAGIISSVLVSSFVDNYGLMSVLLIFACIQTIGVLILIFKKVETIPNT